MLTAVTHTALRTCRHHLHTICQLHDTFPIASFAQQTNKYLPLTALPMCLSQQLLDNCILPQLLPASICILHSNPSVKLLKENPLSTSSHPMQASRPSHSHFNLPLCFMIAVAQTSDAFASASAYTLVLPQLLSHHQTPSNIFLLKPAKPHYDRHLLPFSHASDAQPLTLLPLNANLPITPLPAPLACLNHILCPAMLHLTQLLTTPKPARSITASVLV